MTLASMFPVSRFTERFIQSSFIIFIFCVSHRQFIKQKLQSRYVVLYPVKNPWLYTGLHLLHEYFQYVQTRHT